MSNIPLSMSALKSDIKPENLYYLSHSLKFNSPTGALICEIDNRLNIRADISYNIFNGKSYFKIIIYNMAMRDYVNIREGTVVTLQTGYASYGAVKLQSVLGLGHGKPRLKTVLVGVVRKKYKTRETTSIGDQSFIFLGMDLAETLLRSQPADGLSINLNNEDPFYAIKKMIENINTLTTERFHIESFVDKCGVKEAGIGTRKGLTYYDVMREVSEKYNMYFLCKAGKIYFLRDLDRMHILHAYTTPLIGYGNALLRFNEIISKEDVIGRKTNVPTKDSTVEVKRKYYQFSILGVPDIEVGTRADFVEMKSPSEEEIKGGMSPHLRIPEDPIRLSIYEASILYDNRFNGYTMSGVAVMDNSDTKIAEDMPTPDIDECIADSLTAVLIKQIRSTKKLNIAILESLGSKGKEKGTSDGGGFKDETEGMYLVQKDPDLKYEPTYQLVPFAGPKSGMCVPMFERSAKAVRIPLAGSTGQKVRIGQHWWKPEDMPVRDSGENNFVVQMCNANGQPPFGRFEMTPTGRIGFWTAGMKITVALNEAGATEAVCEEAAAGTFEIECAGGTLKYDGTSWTLDTSGTIKIGATASSIELGGIAALPLADSLHVHTGFGSPPLPGGLTIITKGA